jgi:WD40 repeat protein
MTTLDSRPNPYVGPRAFKTGETLYGRDREVQDLLDQLIAERIILLYSPSGAGKTSLISAGLIPLLKKEGFHILPSIRVNQELPPDQLDPGQDSPRANRYLISTLISLEEEFSVEERTPLDRLSQMSLEDYLEQCPKPVGDQEGPPAEVLIFDQFEEVLTLDTTDEEGKSAFFNQLGAALRDRNRWALFAIREDYVGALDPYLRPIPTRFNNRFRLDLLGVNAARQAIQQPVKQSGVDFTQKAVTKLVNDLRQVQVQRPDGSMETRPGPHVEPVQLQVVCYHLWQELPAGKTEITEEDLSAIGNVDQSLAEYYAEQVSTIAGRADVKERAIRNWFEHQLITETGIRGQVLMESGESKGLANNAIQMLEDAHLVRAEKRLGATWFELAHDRLINPVRANNAAWFLENLSLLQRQASLWAQQDRSETLYLREAALDDAKDWAAAHPDELSQVDRDFLAACLEAHAREEEARAAAERERQLKLEAAQQVAEAEKRRAEEQARAAGKLRRLAYILGAVLLIAIVLAGFAFISQKTAQANARRADEQRATAQAASKLAVDNAGTAQAAGILANDNAIRAAANASTAQAASTAAIAQQSTAEYNAQVAKENAQVAKEQEAIARQQANLARSRELASLALSFLKENSDLTLLLSKEALDVSDTGQALDSLLRGLQRNLSRKAEQYEQPIEKQEIDILSLAASPDGRRLAWGGSAGQVKVWDLENQKLAWRNIVTPGQDVTALAYLPDGSLVTGDAAGTIAIWDSNGRRIRTLPSNILGINSLAISPDGTSLAYGGRSAGTESNIYTINLQDGTYQGFRIRQGEVADVMAVAWSPDGKLLASGGLDRIVHIWDAKTGREIESLKNIIVDNALAPVYEGPIRGLAFSPNGKWLVTGAEDNEGGVRNKTLLVWDTSTWTKQNPVVFNSPNVNLTALAFSPDGQTLVTGYANGETAIWNFNNQSITNELHDNKNPVRGLAFSQFKDTLLLATGGLDRIISLHNLIAMQSLSTPLAKDKGSPARLAVKPDETLVVAGNSPDGFKSWEIQPTSGQESQQDLGASLPGPYILNQDGNQIAFVSEDGKIEVRDSVQANVVSIPLPKVTMDSTDAKGQTTTAQADASIDSLAFSPDGKTLAGGACSHLQVTIDPESNSEVQGCLENDIYLWDIATGVLQSQLSTHQASAILSLAFNPKDLNSLAAGYHNAAIQFWDIKAGRENGLPLLGSGGPVSSLAFHSDGDILASGSENNLIALWNLNPPQLIGDPMTGPDGSVTGLAFSRDSNALYSGSDKGTILLWNLSAWKSIACDLAKRNLTEAEWEQFFPNESYHATCTQIPLETPTPVSAPESTPTPSNVISTPTP